jgi:hypothetical protein
MNFRKLLRVLHRDLGYFIVGMTIVYSLSGIYLNHRHDFNPDYKIYYSEINVQLADKTDYRKDEIKEILKSVDDEVVYKKHYLNNEGKIKIFIENGEVVINPTNGEGYIQYLERRPVVFSFNKLHRASIGTVWKWVSDLMAFILIFVAVSGLFLLKGKRSLQRWGWWLLAAGIVVPLTFIIIYI